MIAFKWSLQEKLPNMSKLSFVESNMIMCIIVFALQAILITARDVLLYRNGMGHPEDRTSYCRMLGGGYVWWALRDGLTFWKHNESTGKNPLGHW